MITYAEAERIADKQLMNRVLKAQEKTGFTTGLRFVTGQNGVARKVMVAFYPKTVFWIQDVARDMTPLSAPRRLTQEEYDQTHGLNL